MLGDGPIITIECAGVAHPVKDVSIPGSGPAVSPLMVSSLIIKDHPRSHSSPEPPPPTAHQRY